MPTIHTSHRLAKLHVQNMHETPDPIPFQSIYANPWYSVYPYSLFRQKNANAVQNFNSNARISIGVHATSRIQVPLGPYAG